MTVPIFRLVGILLFILLVAVACYPKSDSRPRCQEDEILAVRVDHNPAHGLTWECVNAEQYVASFSS